MSLSRQTGPQSFHRLHKPTRPKAALEEKKKSWDKLPLVQFTSCFLCNPQASGRREQGQRVVRGAFFE